MRHSSARQKDCPSPLVRRVFFFRVECILPSSSHTKVRRQKAISAVQVQFEMRINAYGGGECVPVKRVSGVLFFFSGGYFQLYELGVTPATRCRLHSSTWRGESFQFCRWINTKWCVLLIALWRVAAAESRIVSPRYARRPVTRKSWKMAACNQYCVQECSWNGRAPS